MISPRPLPWWRERAHVVALALVAVPFLAALVGFVGDRWFVAGDWASIDLRVRGVGTAETPLIGPYSTRGWAHPGPALYWLAAPLHRLSGGDPRSLFLTAAAVNLGAVTAIVLLCRRMGGRGMAVVAALSLALLAHGLGPGRIVDIWNPLLPLFPLFFCCMAAWAVAMGRRWMTVPASVVAALVAQTHVGMLPIIAVVAAWAVVAVVLSARRGTGAAGGDPADAAPSPPSWTRVLAWSAGLAAATWIPVLLDQLWGSGNLADVAGYFAGGNADPVGLGRGAGLVARYVRPDGPWMGGPEPVSFGAVVGSAPVIVAGLVAALVAIGLLAHRSGRRDVVLGTSLSATLVVAAVPIASNVDEPVYDYLVKWLEVVSALTWFWLAWGAWALLVRPRLSGSVLRWAPAAGLVLVAAAAAWSVPRALVLPLPTPRESPVVEDLWLQMRTELPRDRPVRIEHKGDLIGNVTAGLVTHLRRDGFDIVTSDGSKGYKYGPQAVWRPGDPPRDEVLTVAVAYPFTFADPRLECAERGARVVAEADGLTAEERRRLEELNVERFYRPGAVTPDQVREAEDLESRALLVTVFAGSEVCAGGA